MKTLFDSDLTLEEAKELIKNGADVNAVDGYGKTPLHHIRDIDIARLLIENNANINARNKFGITPIFYVQSLEMAKLFLNHGAIASEIRTYQKFRDLFSEKQKEVFDSFILLTSDDHHFFEMCLAYQESVRNEVKINIKEMDII